jgi:hypothetical protein
MPESPSFDFRPEHYGPKELLIGGSGSGKTHSLQTLVDAGLTLVGIFTEPGMEVIGHISCEKGLHFRYIAPAAMSWDQMKNAGNMLNTMSNDALQKMGGLDRDKFRQWLDMITDMGNFKCSRCSKSFGALDNLGPEFAVFNDSLSGLALMSSNLVVGAKPIKTQPDWGVMMDNLERYVQMFCTSIKTMAVMTAHTEREIDEVAGGTYIMAGSLGRKLSPKLPRFFSDVILARRNVDKFEWSTAAPQTDLKARHLQIKDSIPPTFKPIVEKWHARIGFSLPKKTI